MVSVDRAAIDCRQRFSQVTSLVDAVGMGRYLPSIGISNRKAGIDHCRERPDIFMHLQPGDT